VRASGALAAAHPAIHAANCTVWNTPEDAAPDALIAEGIESDALIGYLGAVRPVYDALKRVLGQISGVLILAEVGARDDGREDGILAAGRTELAEARERWHAVNAPTAARRHHQAVGEIALMLDEAFALLQRRLRGAEATDDRLVGLLFRAQRALLRAAEPRAGMAPVDFRHACCSCGAPRAFGAGGAQ
jgi:hypothetical protein